MHSMLQPCAYRLHPSACKSLPLACRSVPEADRFLYELRFPDRTGENYSLRHSAAHRWYAYSRMVKEECLVFKVK